MIRPKAKPRAAIIHEHRLSQLLRTIDGYNGQASTRHALQLDVAYWRQFQTYNLTQAALLCVGRDPRKTTFDLVMALNGRSPEADELLCFLEDLYEAIANGLGVDPKDGEAKVDAQALLGWVDSKSVQIDPRFRRMLKKFPPVGVEEPSRNPIEPIALEKRPHRSTVKACARVVGAIALTKYGLKDKDMARHVAKKMVHDGDLTGLQFDTKTVRDLQLLALEQSESGNRR